MDRVFVRGLAIETCIGVYDWERSVRQRLELDLEMAFDIAPAAADDDLDLTLDYAAVSARLSDFVAAQSFELIESLAERCAAIVLEEFPVPWLRLELRKPGAVANADTVGVLIERGHLP